VQERVAHSQSERIEETMWISLRMFEERKNLLNNMAQQETVSSQKRSYAKRAKETQVHIERIRAMLLAPERGPAIPAKKR
jgi:two-component system, chemotaxis family, protein-glutamate methylesterase/glutaminase